MTQKSKIAYSQWVGLVVTWVLITNFYTWTILTNLNFFLDLSNSWYIVENNIMFSYMYSGLQYLEATLFGLFFGTAFFFINVYTDRRKLIRKSFGKVIFIKSILYCLAMVISFWIIYLFYKVFEFLPPDVELLHYAELVSFEYLIQVILYFVFTIILTNIFLQVSRKFGPGNFFRLLTGKYFKPREEEKIFLFIDLKNSTGIAEELGHKKYSQFLRECFHDITDIVLQFKAEVYQYVGDEVVLCWEVKDGIKRLNCIQTLFAFLNLLETKKDYYQNKFGVVPIFKGGIDVGPVTVTEIGDIKRDIAYHGDVLNTAARIQEQCNRFNESLLVSENLYDLVKDQNTFQQKLIGNIELRGKKEILKIYSISAK